MQYSYQRAAPTVDLSTAVHCGETRLLRQWSVDLRQVGKVWLTRVHCVDSNRAAAAATAAATAVATRRDSSTTERQNAQHTFTLKQTTRMRLTASRVYSDLSDCVSELEHS